MTSVLRPVQDSMCSMLRHRIFRWL